MRDGNIRSGHNYFKDHLYNFYILYILFQKRVVYNITITMQ